MQFRIEKRENENILKYPTDDVKVAQEFTRKIKAELGDFLVAVILFGSSARGSATDRSDIDVLLVGDDTTFQMTRPLIEGYRIIVENTVQSLSTRLHITSMTFTSFWDYVKAADPVAINILRDGVALMDNGFFNPLQVLLKQGKIRPSEESIWRYFGRSPRTLINSRWHLLQATLDLYWAVIDAAHAALMKKGEIPPSPEHAADLMYQKLIKPKYLEKEYADTIRKFYMLSKQITHREIKEIKGHEYDGHLAEATKFVERMRRFIQESDKKE
ncbi:MAG TPA: nucleotidyltransferase domain-containing protein [Candidatus Nanoarchaeia archaeon]|nr:nucleotidyltransferase domain-containing protein [Candidatus Nanoarchaeia archaeon]